MRPVTLRAARALCARHGMLVAHLGPEAPTWTGTTANLDTLGRAGRFLPRWPRGSRPIDVTARNLVHEVAHFLVASPLRRATPNFGLGMDHLGPAPVKPTVILWTKREDEDRLAGILTVPLVCALAGREQAYGYFNRYEPCHTALAWECIAELVRRGLVDEEGRATPRALGREAREGRRAA